MAPTRSSFAFIGITIWAIGKHVVTIEIVEIVVIFENFHNAGPLHAHSLIPRATQKQRVECIIQNH